jgi:hypothetical protein
MVQGGEMTQALYAHMNNKTIKKMRLECITEHIHIFTETKEIKIVLKEKKD